MSNSKLFEPIQLGSVILPNRIVIAPMCQYSAEEGSATDWHLMHLGRLATSGAGLLIIEATAVEPDGRISPDDLGLYNDTNQQALDGVLKAVRRYTDMPIGIQLGHAGRKASTDSPWNGGKQLGLDRRCWNTEAPSAIPMFDGDRIPTALDTVGLTRVRDAFVASAERAVALGVDLIELHGAHGYLLHQFLSPLSNTRNDEYGGDLAGRMRFPLEIVRAVREAWPENLPLFVRISAVDGADGGWEMEDSVAYARECQKLGVDVMDCSSGGIGGSATGSKRVPRGYGFQIPYAAQIRRELGMKSMAVGLIIGPHQAEAALAAGDADLIAVGREGMNNPNWPLHARAVLEPGTTEEVFGCWPPQHGWWMEKRGAVLNALGTPPA